MLLQIKQHKSFITYASLIMMTSALGLSKGIVLAKVLGVESFGYVSLAEIITSYGIYILSLGILHGLRRQIPVMLEREDARLKSVLARANTSLLVHCLMCLVVYLTFVWVYFDTAELKVFLSLTACLSIAMVFFQFGTLQLNVTQRYIEFGTMMFLKSFFVLIFTTILGYYYDFNGVVIGEIAGFMLVIVLLGFKRLFYRLETSNAFGHICLDDSDAMGQVNRIGYPLTGQAVLRSASSNLDKIAVGYALGVAALGLYNFSVIITVAGLLVVNMLSMYFSPKFCRQYAKKGNLTAALNLLHKFSLACVVVAVVVFPLFSSLLQPLLENYFEAYSKAYVLIMWMYFGALLHIFTLYDLIFTASGRVGLYFKLNVLLTLVVLATYAVLVLTDAALIQFVKSYVFIRLGYSLVLVTFAIRIGTKPALTKPVMA